MASQGNTVDEQELLDAAILRGPDKQQLVSRAINHSFGRGGWRVRAEKVVLPRIALNAVIKQCGGESWSDQWRGRGPRSDQGTEQAPNECGGDRGRGEAPKECGGDQKKGQDSMPCGVGRGSGQMSGVNGTPVKPRASGRARALRIRADKCILPQRKPGRLLGQATQYRSTTRSTPPRPYDVPSSHGGGMPTGGQERRTGAASGVCTRQWPELRLPDSVSESSSSDTSTSPFAVDLVREKPVSTHQGNPQSFTLDRNKQLDWVPDANTLCFNNVPTTTTVKVLRDAVVTFGNVTHCSFLPHINEAGLATAYVRMEERKDCHWVMSCFHGNNPFEDSSLPLVVYFATQGQDTE